MLHCSTSHRLLHTELCQMQPWLHICHLWKSKKRKQQRGGGNERSHWGDANSAAKPRKAASKEAQESFELTSADSDSASRTANPQQTPKVFHQPKHCSDIASRAGARQAWLQHSTVTPSLQGGHTVGQERFHGRTGKENTPCC